MVIGIMQGRRHSGSAVIWRHGILLLTALCAILFSLPASANIRFEKTGFIQVGLKPVCGISLGEFFNSYPVSGGALVYGRGFWQLNIDGKHLLYPEFSTGWFYLPHARENGRAINFLPFQFNFYWEWNRLAFSFPWGGLKLKPYLGAGVYYTRYASSRTVAEGATGGFQVGCNLEARPEEMKGFYLEASVEFNLIAERRVILPGIFVGIGAGYNIPFGTGKNGTTAEERDRLRKGYLADLAGNDRKKITAAASWLGEERERDAVPRLIALLGEDQEQVRASAAIALGNIGDRRGLEPLANAIRKEKSDDTLYAMLVSISRMRPGKKIVRSILEVRANTTDPIILDYLMTMERLFK